MEFGGIISKHGAFGNIVTSPGQIGSAQNLLRWRADTIRPYVWCVQRWRASATELPSGNFDAFVGEDIIFPVVFPVGKTTSAQCADNVMSNIFQWNSVVSCRNMVYYQYCDIIWSIRFCSKICHVGGRILSAPTFGACNDGGRVPRITERKFRCAVGEDIIFPVVFPVGKTTSAQCADNAMSNILQWNSAVQCINMVRLATFIHYRAKSVLLKNLQRWRADNIRPYVWCVQRWRAGATELPSGNFGAL